jgi:hypothetical protein
MVKARLPIGPLARSPIIAEGIVILASDDPGFVVDAGITAQ